jgi:F420-dependent oxidoreductase-like protein
MKIGLQINQFDFSNDRRDIPKRLGDIASTIDQSGFSSLWVMDHYYQIAPRLGNEDSPMLEAYSTLSYLSALTQNVRLGTMVTGVIYRYPAYLVKIVTNLDVLSGGRAYLGIGAGWYEKEARGMGFPFPPLKERFEWLEENLQIALQMWANNREPYQGKYFKLEKPILSPQSISRPHPPILIGGSGETKTLRFVAKYGDACNLFAQVGDEVLKHKLDVLKRHCKEVGRDYKEIEKTCLMHVNLDNMKTDDVLQSGRNLAKLGFQHFIFSLHDVHLIAPLERMIREVIPALREVQASV